MSRYIGYIVLLVSICASGAVARSLKCAQPECPAGSTEHLLFPYPADCGKFIICDGGVKVVQDCQPGLHFNPSVNYCDWPANVKCVPCETTTEVPTTEEPITEAPTTQEPTTEAPTTEEPTTEAPTTEAPTTEAPTTEAPTTEAPTTEAPTTETPTTEAPTTEAPTTEAPTTEAPTTEAPTTEEPTTQEPTTEEPTTQAPTTETPEPTCEIAECPTLDHNKFLFLAVPWDCSKYVMCLNEFVYDMNCATGLIFSADAQNCVVPSETVVCNECELEVETTTLEPEVETPPPCKVEECLRTQNTPLYLAVPWDCSKLILCIRGQTFEQSCAPGLIFSTEAQQCVIAENVVCEVCDQATEAPGLVDPTTETPEVTEPETETPEVTDPTTEAPEETEPTTEAPEVTEPTTEAPEETEPTTEAPVETEPTTEAPEVTEVPEVPEVPVQCTDSENKEPSCGFLAINVLSPVPWNCSEYFSCSFSKLTKKTCEENTYFDVAANGCIANSTCVACIQ